MRQFFMAYRLKAKESVPDGIRRIVGEEIESATDGLTKAKDSDRDGAIHEARKSVKKIRGALRLMQPELGRAYREENRRLGDIGRRLSEIRDAAAIIEVFDGLAGKYRDQLKPEAINAVRQGLLQNKAETEQRVNADAVVRQAVNGLRATSKRAASWPLETDGFGALAPGLKTRYKRGRKAMSVAKRHAAPETFHEWRKRVKDHWYHVRLLESLWTEVLQARESSLKDLETWLGDDHNLVVLREKLQATPGQYGGERNVQVFTDLMDDYSQELREKALSLGARVYEQKPKLLLRELKKIWDVWQDQPAKKKPSSVAGKPSAAYGTA